MASPDEVLIVAVQRVLDKIEDGQKRRTILTYDPWSESAVLAEMANLAGAFEAHEDFSKILGKQLFAADRSAHRIDSASLARLVAGRAWGLGAKAALDPIADFARKRVTRATIVYCLHGVRTSEVVKLSDQVSIVPATEVPPSRERDRFFEPISEQPRFSSIFGPPLAAAGILIRTEISPAISDSDKDDGSYERLIQHIDKIDDLNVERAFAAVVLTGARAQLGVRYVIHEHPGYPDDSSSVSWKALPNGFLPTEQFDHSRCTEYFSQCQAFQGWPDFKRLIQRLARARLQTDPIDAHLDYGIVAESLLMHGEGNEAEISYRFRTRVAWLLGSDAESRREAAAKAAKLYSHRSTAAHQGKLKGAWTADDRLSADSLCNTLAQKTLEHGAFFNVNDWASLVYG